MFRLISEADLNSISKQVSTFVKAHSYLQFGHAFQLHNRLLAMEEFSIAKRCVKRAKATAIDGAEYVGGIPRYRIEIVEDLYKEADRRYRRAVVNLTSESLRWAIMKEAAAAFLDAAERTLETYPQVASSFVAVAREYVGDAVDQKPFAKFSGMPEASMLRP